jgi:hypothetical protein
MMKRARSCGWPAILVIAATTSGCATPRAALGTTGMLLGVGTIALVHAGDDIDCERGLCSFGGGIETLTHGNGYVLGAAIFVAGLLLLSTDSDLLAPLPRPSAGPPAGPPMPLSPDIEDAPVAEPPDPRVVQLGIEARVGHCPTVVAIARQILAEDATALVVAAIRREAAVARCLGYRM